MHHGSLRAPVRVFMAAVLLCLSFLTAPKAAAAQLQNVNGITLLSFDSQQIVSIGNQTSGRCSWYALRYAPHHSGWQALLGQRDVVERRGMVCRRVLRLQRLPFRLPFPPV